MEHKRFEDITEAEAHKMTDDIWSSVISLYSKDGKKDGKSDFLYYDTPLSRGMVCYFMWKIRTTPTIITSEDLKDSYHADRFYCYTLDMDDFADYYGDPEKPELWDKIKDIANSYTEEELRACVLKTGNLCRGIEDREQIPDSIIDLSNMLLDINKKDTVLNYNCGYNSYYFRSMQTVRGKLYISTAEDEYEYTQSSFMRADVLGYDNFIFCDYYDDYDISQPVNITKAFVDAFLDTEKHYSEVHDLWEDFPEGLIDGWCDCGSVIADTEYKGRIVALMTPGDLTVKSAERYRKFLCEKGFIEGVISLPDKMFKSTWINCFLVIFSQGNKTIRLLDARDYGIAERSNGKRVNVFSDEIINRIKSDYYDDNLANVVSIEKIAETGYVLTPMRYVSKDKEKKEYIELGDIITEIRRGISIKAADMDKYIAEEPEGEPCIRSSDLIDGVIASHRFYNGELRHPDKNKCSWRNLLITKTGNPFRVALPDKRYLVIGNIYILDINESKISAEYVKCFLSSEAGQDELRRLSVGSATPILNISDVKKIRIPVYDDDKMSEFEKNAHELERELRSNYKQLKENMDEIAHMFDEE